MTYEVNDAAYQDLIYTLGKIGKAVPSVSLVEELAAYALPDNDVEAESLCTAIIEQVENLMELAIEQALYVYELQDPNYEEMTEDEHQEFIAGLFRRAVRL